MNSIYSLLTLHHVKLGHPVTFKKYLASVVSLIFLPKTLIWNKITFTASNSLNLTKLVVNEPMKSIYKIKIPILICLSDLSLVYVKISRAYK